MSPSNKNLNTDPYTDENISVFLTKKYEWKLHILINYEFTRSDLQSKQRRSWVEKEERTVNSQSL